MKKLGFLFGFIILVGCSSNSLISRTPASQPGITNLDVLKNFQNQFDNSKSNKIRNVRVLSQLEDKKAERSPILYSNNCRVETVILAAQDPLTNSEGGIQLRVYTPHSKTVNESIKKILILPPTGGENPLDLGYADAFCAHGFQTTILERWDGDTDSEIDLDLHDRGALRALAAVRHTVEYINPTHKGQLGILGTSVGGITSVMAMGYESRISAAALIVAGLNLREIIPLSQEQNLTRMRVERKGIAPFKSDEAYQAALAPHITIEPGDNLAATEVSNVWMMIATQDLTVPTQNQLDLKNALTAKLGSDHVHVETHEGDHVPTVIHTFLYVNKIVKFFKQNLK